MVNDYVRKSYVNDLINQTIFNSDQVSKYLVV